MDQSYSMDLTRMFQAKQGTGSLISMVTEASTGDPGTDFVGSRIGIVSFASGASRDLALIFNRTHLRTAISNLRASGKISHEAAIEAAELTLGPKGENRQIAVMVTDGLTTVGEDATPVTDRMKAAGIEIYCIGLVDDPALLNR